MEELTQQVYHLVVGSGKVKTKPLWGSFQFLEPLFSFTCDSTKGLKQRVERRVEGTGYLVFPYECLARISLIGNEDQDWVVLEGEKCALEKNASNQIAEV